MGALPLPCQGTAWLSAAPAPLALLSLGILMCFSLVPSIAEQYQPAGWAVWHREGWEMRIPALLPVPAQPFHHPALNF